MGNVRCWWQKSGTWLPQTHLQHHLWLSSSTGTSTACSWLFSEGRIPCPEWSSPFTSDPNVRGTPGAGLPSGSGLSESEDMQLLGAVWRPCCSHCAHPHGCPFSRQSLWSGITNPQHKGETEPAVFSRRSLSLVVPPNGKLHHCSFLGSGVLSPHGAHASLPTQDPSTGTRTSPLPRATASPLWTLTPKWPLTTQH